MPSPVRAFGVAMSLLGAMLVPRGAHGQQASVLATATVVGQPLSIRTVSSGASGSKLQVGIEGCGTGSVTVDGRRADGTQVRIVRHDFANDGRCGRRDLLLPLSHRDSAQFLRFDVRLTQTDALLAPSLAQVVVNAAALRTGSGIALLY